MKNITYKREMVKTVLEYRKTSLGTVLVNGNVIVVGLLVSDTVFNMSTC